jgi:hypothetical protein
VFDVCGFLVLDVLHHIINGFFDFLKRIELGRHGESREPQMVAEKLSVFYSAKLSPILLSGYVFSMKYD